MDFSKNFLTAVALAVLCSTASVAPAQDETTASAATSVSAQNAAPADDESDTTSSIVILGEKVGLNPDAPKKGPYPDVLGATTSTLGTDALEFTFPGATLPATAKAIGGVAQASADIAIVYGGYSDEKEDVSDADLKKAIIDLAAGLKKKNPSMRIFLVPSATFVSTLTSARMRLAAEEAGITFVPLGTEVSGEPFAQAMRAVAAELSHNAPAEPAQPESTPPPAKAVTIRGKSVDTAPADAVKPGTPSYEAKQASLQQELNRIAGETEDSGILPANVENLSSASLINESAPATTDTSGQAIPPGGTLKKTGAEARDNINMRPLPALKAYRPQIPVPRNEINKKEPALSR